MGAREANRFVKFSSASKGLLMRKKLEPKEHCTGIERTKESFKENIFGPVASSLLCKHSDKEALPSSGLTLPPQF